MQEHHEEVSNKIKAWSITKNAAVVPRHKSLRTTAAHRKHPVQSNILPTSSAFPCLSPHVHPTRHRQQQQSSASTTTPNRTTIAITSVATSPTKPGCIAFNPVAPITRCTDPTARQRCIRLRIIQCKLHLHIGLLQPWRSAHRHTTLVVDQQADDAAISCGRFGLDASTLVE